MEGRDRAFFPTTGTAQRLLPGKLHSWITSCINRCAGSEASGGRDKAGITRGHQVSGLQWSGLNTARRHSAEGKEKKKDGTKAEPQVQVLKFSVVLFLAAVTVKTALRQVSDLFSSGTNLTANKSNNTTQELTQPVCINSCQ